VVVFLLALLEDLRGLLVYPGLDRLRHGFGGFTAGEFHSGALEVQGISSGIVVGVGSF